MRKQRTARLAAIVAVGLAVAGAAAIPAAARAATLAGSGSSPGSGSVATAVPRGLLPMSVSWTSAQRGIVLGYPSKTTGARPSLLETGNGGRTWAADKLGGVSGSFSVARLTVSYGRVFALVTRPTSAAVYAAAAASRMLSPVRGLAISGPDSYGDLSAVGALEVDLGSNQAAEK
jgi:hypothetical protein